MGAAHALLRKNPHSQNGFGGAGKPAAAWQVQEPSWIPGLGAGRGFEVWFCHLQSRMGRGFGK